MQKSSFSAASGAPPGTITFEVQAVEQNTEVYSNVATVTIAVQDEPDFTIENLNVSIDSPVQQGRRIQVKVKATADASGIPAAAAGGDMTSKWNYVLRLIYDENGDGTVGEDEGIDVQTDSDSKDEYKGTERKTNIDNDPKSNSWIHKTIDIPAAVPVGANIVRVKGRLVGVVAQLPRQGGGAPLIGKSSSGVQADANNNKKKVNGIPLKQGTIKP
jgi:hypothetical protein